MTSAATRMATSGVPAAGLPTRCSTAWRCSPDGDVIGRIVLPETAANLCFGGHDHNRLFICASTSLYAVDVNTRGVEL
jgi:sugar lactone lactonase YvrE